MEWLAIIRCLYRLGFHIDFGMDAISVRYRVHELLDIGKNATWSFSLFKSKVICTLRGAIAFTSRQRARPSVSDSAVPPSHLMSFELSCKIWSIHVWVGRTKKYRERRESGVISHSAKGFKTWNFDHAKKYRKEQQRATRVRLHWRHSRRGLVKLVRIVECRSRGGTSV